MIVHNSHDRVASVYKKLPLFALLITALSCSSLYSCHEYDSKLRTTKITLPNEEVFKYRLHSVQLDVLHEKTPITKQLSNLELPVLDCLLYIKGYIEIYKSKISDSWGTDDLSLEDKKKDIDFVEAQAPTLIDALLQDYPNILSLVQKSTAYATVGKNH